jgi:hypothetical protein
VPPDDDLAVLAGVQGVLIETLTLPLPLIDFLSTLRSLMFGTVGGE